MINLGSAYGSIEISTDKAQQNVQSLAQTMRNMGQTMSTTLSLPILGVAAAGLNAAAGFEQSMNQIQVVGGVAADAMSSLNAKALQLGAETSFSAGEAADGMLELAKAGMNADDVMSSIGGTLDLAAAGNLGVGQAAEITANALNAFQLPAEDATKVANLLAAAANSSSVEVTDMAQAFQMSAAVFGSNGVAIDDLATGIAILGNNGLKGSDAGTSLKTMLMRLTAPTDEAAGLMKELGIQVYDAQGNMLEFPAILDNMRQSLFGVHEATVVTGGRTAEQSAELARLQKMYQSTENSIKDYQSGVNGATLSEDKRAKKVEELRAKQAVLMGQINQLAGITGTATTQTVQLTEEQRNQAMATLFGADAIRAANILLGSSAETWTEMSGNVNEAGAATEVAQARMKGLAGAIQYIKGTIESLMIGAFQPFLQSIADMIRGVADAMAAFGRLPQPVINAVMAFLGVLGVAGPVILVMGKIGAVMGALLNPVGLVILAIGALAAAFASDFMGIRTAAMQAMSTFGDLWTAMLWIFQGQAANIDWWWDIAEAFGFTGDTALAVGDKLFELGVRVGGVIDAFRNFGADAIGEVVAQLTGLGLDTYDTTEAIEDLVGALTGSEAMGSAAGEWIFNLGTAFQGLRERAGEAVNSMIQSFAGLGAAVGPALQQMWGWLAVNIPAGLAVLQGWWNSVWPALSGAVTAAWAAVGPALQQMWGWLAVNIPAGLAVLQGWWASTWPALSGAVSAAWAAVGPVLQQIWGWLAVNIPAGLAMLQGWWNSVWPALSGAVTAAWAAVGPALQQMWGWLAVNIPAGLAVLQGITASVWGTIQSAITSAWNVIGPPLQQMWGWLSNLASNFIALDGPNKAFVAALEGMGAILPIVAGAGGVGLLSAALGAVTAIVGGVVSALGALLSPIGLVAAGAILLGVAWTNNWAGIRDITANAVSAIQEAWGGLMGILEPAISRLQAAFGNMGTGLGELGPKFVSLQEAITAAVTAIMPIVQMLGMVIGGVIGVVATFAINNLAAVFDALPTVVGAAVDQVTAVITLIATTVQGVTDTISSLLQGDFAGAWTGVQTIIGGVMTYVQSTATNMGVVVMAVLGLVKNVIVNTFSDLASALGLDGVLTKISEFKDSVLALFSVEGLTSVRDAIAGMLGLDAGSLSATLNFGFTTPDWLAGFLAWVFPSPDELLAWAFPDIPTIAADWWPEIPSLAADWWPNIPGLTADWWPGIPALASSWWPNIPALASSWWPNIPGLTSDWWPEISAPDWLNSLLNWVPSAPGWLSQLANLISGGGGAAATPAANSGPGVVESVYNYVTGNTRSGLLLAGGDTSQRLQAAPATINYITNDFDVTANSELDFEELFWRLKKRMERAVSGR